MNEPPSRDHFPTPEELEREARRLARLRHLSVVPDAPPRPELDRHFVLIRDHDPDPKEAA